MRRSFLAVVVTAAVILVAIATSPDHLDLQVSMPRVGTVYSEVGPMEEPSYMTTTSTTTTTTTTLGGVPESGLSDRVANPETRASAGSNPAPSAPQPAPVYAPPVASGDIWWQLALCESGGNPATNTGNGYYGAFQFLPATWWGVGGTGYPHEWPYEVQLGFAQALQARSGWGQWPGCAWKLGLL